MNLLYLSCHSVLEYDELKLFNELGINVFSHGAYANPQKPGDPKRPGIDMEFNQKLYDMHISHTKEDLHEDMIDWADVIMVMHRADWVRENWEKIKDKCVVYRSIGQSTMWVESKLKPFKKQGMKIVRYSPKEKTIPGFCGGDAVIRFYKDPKEFEGWNGEAETVISIGQTMKGRKDFCNYDVFEYATKPFDRFLIGPGNENVDEMKAEQLSYKGMKQLLKDARVYFYTGTYPASYTLNFIEAFMTGIPIVALGKELGSSPHEKGQDTYEIPEIIENEVSGFYSDDEKELRSYISDLMKNVSLCRKISKNARKKAVELFGKEKIKKQWSKFFESL